MKTEDRLFRITGIVILFIVAITCLIPLLLILAISFSRESDVLRYGYSMIPKNFTTEAYKIILGNPTQIINGYKVTVFTTAVGTVVSLLFTSMLAYVICRRDYPLARITSFLVVFTMLISGGLISWYILVSRILNLQDTLAALILPQLVVPWNVLLMRSFFSATPISLIESAKIDGARETRIFFQIVMPINKPGLAAVGLFIALTYWNDYFSSMMFIENGKYVSLQYLLYKIQANLQMLSSSFAQEMGLSLGKNMPSLTARMALCIVAAGPMLMIFPFFQKYFVKGIVIGAVKG